MEGMEAIAMPPEEQRGQAHVAGSLFTSDAERADRARQQTEVAAMPSFFSRLRGFDDAAELGSPVVAALLPAKDVVAFAIHHGVEVEAAHLILGGTPYPKLIRAGLLQRLWHWVHNFRPAGSEVKLPLKIPVCELHIPCVPGVSGTYSIERSQQEENGLSVMVGGIGAGGSISRTVTTASEIPLEAGRCLGLVCDGEATITGWIQMKTAESEYVVDAVDISGMAYPVSLDAYPVAQSGRHVCVHSDAFALIEQKIKGLRLGIDYHTASPESPFTATIAVEKKHKYEVSWCVCGPSDCQFGFHASSHFSESAKGIFHLAPQYRYIAFFRDVDLLPIEWSSQAARNGTQGQHLNR